MVLASVFLCSLLAAAPLPNAADPTPRVIDPVGARVRGATPQMQQLIQDGIRRSPTFAALVSALNKSDVIVYVQQTRDLPTGVNGQLWVSTSQNSQRYLRAQVLAGLGATETIAIVAHELQHAVEVAQHDDVRDMKSLVNLYKKIGVEAPRGRYDTAQAQATTWRVRTELG